MAKPSASELIKKIEEAEGNISAVARAYGRSRTAVYQWIASYPTAQQALSDRRHSVVDEAESVLFNRAIEDGELTALFYILNNMAEAKERGWGLRIKQEHTGKDGEPLNIRFIWQSDDNN